MTKYDDGRIKEEFQITSECEEYHMRKNIKDKIALNDESRKKEQAIA
jgi:hypothetical protein